MKTPRDYDTRLANLEAKRRVRQKRSRREEADAQAEALYAQLLSDAIEAFGMDLSTYASLMSRADPAVAEELATVIVTAYLIGAADTASLPDAPVTLTKTPEGFRLIERSD